MNIGTAARLSGLTSKTIRYYESIGLLQPARRADNGYRDYSERDLELLQFIARARGLGFSLEECQQLVELYLDHQRQSRCVKERTLDKVKELDQRIAALTEIRDQLSQLASRCHGDESPECPILSSLAGKSSDTND